MITTRNKRSIKLQRAAAFVAALLLCVISVCLPVAASEEAAEAADEETVSQDDLPAATAADRTMGNVAAPSVIAEGAILMDAENGVILYQKNMDTPYFPASITKIMTCLLAAEKCSMSEMVTFSKEAVFGIDRSSSNVGMDVGQSISMEEAILCVMLASANEVASAIAEHVSGSISDFTDLMNERAKELGCTHTHFVNANGLPDEDHYISPHDMALIAAAFHKNDTCRRLASMRTYDLKVTSTQPDEVHLLNHHKMYPGLSYAYDPVIWGKTGYTVAAGATLVTVAEKDGLTLICVVMKDASEKNYSDTRALLDFGFTNYTPVSIAENETSFDMHEAEFFQTKSHFFGNTSSFITLDDKGFVILPRGVPFSRLSRQIEYRENARDGVLADVIYYLGEDRAGSARLMINGEAADLSAFTSTPLENNEEENVRFINIKKILPVVAISFGAVSIIGLMIYLIRTFNFGGALSRRINIKRKRKRYHSDFDKIDF